MSKLQQLVKKYGKVAIGVHLGIYAATLAGANLAFCFWLLAVLAFIAEKVTNGVFAGITGCYVAAERKINLEHYLVKYNLLKGRTHQCGT